MIFSRKKSFLLAGGLIGGFFILALLIFSSSRSYKTPVGTLSLDLDSAGGPKVILDDFHRSESKNGKLLWEVRAEKGSLSPSTQEAEITRPTIMLYQDKGKIVTLNSETAIVSFAGASLAKAHLKQNVTLNQPQPPFNLLAAEAFFDQTNDSLFMPGPVTILTDTMSIEGEDLRGVPSKEEFTIEKNVKSTLKGRTDSTLADETTTSEIVKKKSK